MPRGSFAPTFCFLHTLPRPALNQPHSSGRGSSGSLPPAAGSRLRRSHGLPPVTTAPAAGSLPSNAWCAAAFLAELCAGPEPALGSVPPAVAPAQVSVLTSPPPQASQPRQSGATARPTGWGLGVVGPPTPGNGPRAPARPPLGLTPRSWEPARRSQGCIRPAPRAIAPVSPRGGLLLRGSGGVNALSFQVLAAPEAVSSHPSHERPRRGHEQREDGEAWLLLARGRGASLGARWPQPCPGRKMLVCGPCWARGTGGGGVPACDRSAATRRGSSRWAGPGAPGTRVPSWGRFRRGQAPAALHTHLPPCPEPWAHPDLRLPAGGLGE